MHETQASGHYKNIKANEPNILSRFYTEGPHGSMATSRLWEEVQWLISARVLLTHSLCPKHTVNFHLASRCAASWIIHQFYRKERKVFQRENQCWCQGEALSLCLGRIGRRYVLEWRYSQLFTDRTSKVRSYKYMGDINLYVTQHGNWKLKRTFLIGPHAVDICML